MARNAEAEAVPAVAVEGVAQLVVTLLAQAEIDGTGREPWMPGLIRHYATRHCLPAKMRNNNIQTVIFGKELVKKC